MEDTNWYVLLDGTHSFRGTRAHKGQEILLTEKEAKRLGSRVRRVAGASETTNNLTTNQPTSQPVRDWSMSQDMKAADLISLVNETSSIPDLEVLYDLEEKEQNRVTVLREIEKRVNALDREGGQ